MLNYAGLLAVFGAIVLVAAWLPMAVRRLPLSLPIVAVAIGALLGLLAGPAEVPLPGEHRLLTERLTEVLVIVTLMACGLKLDRPFGWRRWRATWRLLGITMPLSILGVAVLGWGLLGLALPAALLLGAALAPTDPVLASDVQVGPPGSEEEEARFALTSEAGLNDGLAFPFVNLAIALAGAAALGTDAAGAGGWLRQWLLVDLLWKLAAGCLAGWLVGRLVGWLAFRTPGWTKLSRTGEGFVAIGVTLLAYGLAELVHGYGFLAVFVAAISLRSAERQHRYHTTLYGFTAQVEHLLMTALLVAFGAALASGLLAPLDWPAALLALLVLLLVRPLAGWLGLLGSAQTIGERAVVSFYGIRGVASVYYLAHAFGQGSFQDADYLWAVASLVILGSILLHGASVAPVMSRLDGR